MAEFARTKLDSVLRRALELSADERERFLDETCDRNSKLRRAVDRMLHDSENDDEVLLQPGGGASGPLWEALSRDYSAAFAFEPGERVGAYRVVRVLGRGGLIRLANVYETMRRYPDAERALLEAEAALPEGFVTDRSELLTNRGQLYVEMGRAEDAERDLHQAFELRRSSLGEIMGPDAYQNALLGDALAATLERSQHNREALALRRRSLELTEASYPRTHRLWAERALSLAQTLATIGTLKSRHEAASLLDRSVDVFRDPDAAGPGLGIALLERGRVQLAPGERKAASDDFTEAIPLLEHSHGASDALSREAHSLLQEAS